MHMHKTEQASYIAAVCTFFSSLTLSDMGIIVSMIATIATLLIHWAYKAKEHKLKEKEFELKLKQHLGKTKND